MPTDTTATCPGPLREVSPSDPMQGWELHVVHWGAPGIFLPTPKQPLWVCLGLHLGLAPAAQRPLEHSHSAPAFAADTDTWSKKGASEHQSGSSPPAVTPEVGSWANFRVQNAFSSTPWHRAAPADGNLCNCEAVEVLVFCFFKSSCIYTNCLEWQRQNLKTLWTPGDPRQHCHFLFVFTKLTQLLS